MENHTYVSTFPKQEIFILPTFRILYLHEITYIRSTATYVFKQLSSKLKKKTKTIFVADAFATNLELFISIEKNDDGKHLTMATATIVAPNGNIIAKNVAVPYKLARQFVDEEKLAFPCLIVFKPNKNKLYCLPKK